MPRVGIVCDSTCDLDLSWLRDRDVTVVPLKVLFGDQSYLDWIDMGPDEFYVKLAASDTLPKTSQPSPADFAAAYAAVAETGVEEIVSIHLTSALSGTFESAMMAAKDCPVPVRIVDTKVVSQATALVVKAAIEARDAGADAAGVEAAAARTAEGVRLFFVLDTLEYLVKGGRAGKASGLAASVLNIKPILQFNDEGTIEPFKKVKGLKKALAALAAHVAETSADGPVRVALLHGSAPHLAEELRVALDTAGADYELDSIGLIGAVIGTYAGPGAVGLAMYPLR